MASAVEHYQKLGADASLRLIGRLGSFGNGVEGMAFSRNGKFLAILEGGRDNANIRVWDVAASKFIGNISGDSDAFGDTPAKSLLFQSIAISNDGRFVALSRNVLVVLEVESGETKLRAGKADRYLNDSAVEHVSFSDDDGTLFCALRDGRLISRDTENWKITGTIKGLPSYAKGVRLSGDGEYATCLDGGSPHLWTKATKKSTRLKTRSKVLSEIRMSARPDLEHYAAAVSDKDVLSGKGIDRDDPNAGEKLLEDIGSIEIRKYDEPSVVVQSLADGGKTVAIGIEALGASHLATTILCRGPTIEKNRFFAGDSESGIRIWNIPKAAVVADVFLPSIMYDWAVSESGGLLATIVEREHVILLWKFNPKGKPDRKYAGGSAWARAAPLKWTSSKKTLEEKGGGTWKFGSKEMKEKEKTSNRIVLTDSEGEHVFTNDGNHWLVTPNDGAKEFRVPLGNGRVFVLRPPKENWDHQETGRWHATGLKPLPRQKASE